MRNFLLILFFFAGLQLIAETDGASLRAKARGLSPRVIIDDDSGDVASASEKIPATREGMINQRLVEATSGDVTTVVYNTGTVGLCASHGS